MKESLLIKSEYVGGEELEHRFKYDLETQFAEIVDGNMRTEFELRATGIDVVGEDGRGMVGIAKDSLDQAKKDAKHNPDLWFTVRRSSVEQEEIQEIIGMTTGEMPNTMVVVSDFPAEIMNAREDVGGYNVTRKQTMLRVLTRKPDGNIQMYSQSLDGSNRQALEVIYHHFNLEAESGELLGQRIHIDLAFDRQANLVDELTGVYDRNLSEQFGGQWYAGRRPADYRNTYDFVCSQHDLIGECVRLQRLDWLNDKVMYKISAAMQRRFNTKQYLMALDPQISPPELISSLYQEIEAAGNFARQTGMTFSACGVTLHAEGLDRSTENLMNQTGYGKRTEEDKYGSLNFKCRKGHPNTRPRNKLIEKCTTCGDSVKC